MLVVVLAWAAELDPAALAREGARGVAGATDAAGGPAGPTPTASAAAESRADDPAGVTGASRRVRARQLDVARLEAWGTASAPDGATVRVTVVDPMGGPGHVLDAPVSGDRFLARTTLPRHLRGRPVVVRARLVE